MGDLRRPGRRGLALLFVLSVPLPAGALPPLRLPSGIVIRIHTPEEIGAFWLREGRAGVFLEHPACGRVELLQGPDDPRLRRQPVLAFHPAGPEQVAGALAGIHTISADLEVDVFILPSPPAAPQGSFARRGCILLAPGIGPMPEETVAYTVTHEMGHVLTWAYLDPRPDRWRAYLDLRQLAGAEAGPDAPHADRAREILAEDIRFLFGGEPATVSGTIENHDLPLPDLVSGLMDLLASYLSGPPLLGQPGTASRAFPNPCNPATTVLLTAPEGDGREREGPANLSIYDLRGRLVRSLVGGVVANSQVAVLWDGLDAEGRAVPSGRYLYRITWDDLSSRGSVLMVR